RHTRFSRDWSSDVCSSDLWNACGDLFATFAAQAFHVGPWGSGARMKLVVNLVLGLNRAVLAEGLALARSCGLDPAAALEILRAEIGRASCRERAQIAGVAL